MGKKEKYQAPRSHEDVGRDSEVETILDKISENICNEDVHEVAFPAESRETELEDLGTLDQPDDPGEEEHEELPPGIKELRKTLSQRMVLSIFFNVIGLVEK